MPHRIRFSKKSAEQIPVPATGRTYTYDELVRNLALCVTSAGARTWYRCGKVKGKADRVRIGRFPEIEVEAARRMAADMTLAIAAGKPAREKTRSTKRLDQLWDWYFENVSRPSHVEWDRDLQRWNDHLKPWAARYLSSITREDMVELQQRVKTSRGPSAANKVTWLLRAMLTQAVKNGWAESNIAATISPFPETERERFLDGTELPKFIEAVENLRSEQARDFFMLCLWTGARRNSVGAMRWDQLNLDAEIWTLAKPKSKKKIQLRLVLSKPAIEVLRRRMESRTESPFVFPGTGKTGHYRWPRTSWRQVMKATGLTDVRLHDIRRTFASWQAASGASLQIIGKSLGHNGTKATLIYARLNLDPVRASVDLATAAIQAAAEKARKKS